MTLAPQRWWIYQKERFPVFKHGLLIAVFSGAAVGYSAQMLSVRPTLASALGAFVSTFCFFLQMRIADEFKDFDDDMRQRPYRPVPRGLVSRRELGWIGLASGGVQLLLALWLTPSLVGLLLGVWAYFGLMCKEFFLRPWLKGHPVAYGLSHMVIVPLISLYAIACHALPAGTLPVTALGPFLLTCFSNGLVIELGRKIRLPAAEEPGVETYSALWGLQPATQLWLMAVILTAVLAALAAAAIQALTLVLPLLTAMLGLLGWQTYRVLQQTRCQQAAEPLEIPTALWTLTVYLGLGWLPHLMPPL